MIHPMKRTFSLLATLLLSLRLPAQEAPPVYDVVVYGDSSGAVTAAIAAKREGRSVILVNPTAFPGGMSASGLGASDFLGKRTRSAASLRSFTTLSPPTTVKNTSGASSPTSASASSKK